MTRSHDEEARQDALAKFRKDLNAGAVALILLALLERGREPLYGYQITKLLEQIWGAELPMKPGTLYPVLRSLERMGLLASELRPSSTGPKRRYYALTDLGRASLPEWLAGWRQMDSLVASVQDVGRIRRQLEQLAGEGDSV